MKRSCLIFCLCLPLFSAATIHCQTTVPPTTSNTPSVKTDHYQQAEKKRQQAVRKAARSLGHETLYQDEFPPSYDYLTLSYQISRLSALINDLNKNMAGTSSQAASRPAESLPDLSAPGILKLAPFRTIGRDQMREIYGPQGVTKKAVQLLLEYRLMLMDNPRLIIGGIEEENEQITARIITTDHSTVEEYRIDKESGQWTPIR